MEPEIKLKWYDYPGIWYTRLTLKLSYFKSFLRNSWRFRKELSHYQGWDFSFDIDMLIKMYEIKVESFEIGKKYVYVDKEYNQIKEIYEDLKEIRNLDYMQNDFRNKYIKVFSKLGKSYKFWW